ncbi:MAG: sulfatase-like hydrolase/transferase [Planctomycetota bacterium]
MNVGLLKQVVVSVAFLTLSAGFAQAQAPNIVVFLTDDQGYGDLGCFGSESLETPNIDRLCKQGMKFTDFYVHQRCSPTRLALMTGSHAHRAGCSKVIYNRDRIGIHTDEVTTPELLKTAGYATGMVGKWHLGEWDAFNPTRHGFDFFYGFMNDVDQGTGIYRNLKRIESIKRKTDGQHSPKLLDAAIGFIKENKERPFFLYYASPLPHTPWIPNERFKGTSKRGTYGDLIREIDWQVGELMKALDEQGVADNTLFIFASDNGPVLGINGGDAGPYRDGKWTDFEGGIRVPCIMRWPGTINPGSKNNQITGIIDFLPTFCSLAGVEPPRDRVIDGRNILPYMKGENVETPIHESFVVPGSVIRHGQWKLLVRQLKPGGKSGREGKRPSAPAGSLFNLLSDPGETRDVSADHPEIVSDLRDRMDAAVRELEANNRPIGRLPGGPVPTEKKSKRKNQNKKDKQ